MGIACVLGGHNFISVEYDSQRFNYRKQKMMRCKEKYWRCTKCGVIQNR
jgi:hypothetical protein